MPSLTLHAKKNRQLNGGCFLLHRLLVAFVEAVGGSVNRVDEIQA